TKNQLAYHLVCLTALGPRLVRELRAADYDWMCNEGWGEKIYTFFSDPQNHDTRQMLWVIMNNLNFVNTSVKDVKMDFYNPHKLLTDMVKSSPKPVTIVIGGNRLPQSYQTVDPAHHNEYDQLVNTAFGSSGYLTSYPSDITIGVDHRHRPLVLANAIDVNLWKGLDAERVREILLEEDYLKDNLMEILPEPLKGKVRIVDPYASQ
ncbi:MAG: hypothetical protein Q8K36_04470, partial [Alphaproteobacteria bacterium]|nr:hypothetical protein [Alphaproteobacteria bacterium]